MSEVHRYSAVKMLSEAGNKISYDPHDPEVVMAKDYDALVAKLAMAEDAAAKGDAARHQCAGMEMEIKELRGAAEHWEAESRALQKLLDAALAKLAELEKQEPAATVAKVPGEDWNSLDFHLDLQGMLPGTKLYTTPVAQVQHSVPIAHEFKRALGLVVAALEADGDRPTSKYALSELKKVLAAAPGKEG